MKTKPSKASKAAEDTKDLFDPVELEILNRYFGLPTTLDRAALVADPSEEVEQEDLSPGAAACAFGVRLEDDVDLDCEDPDPALAKAVARICLQVVGRRRPLRKRTGVLEVLSEADADDDWPDQAPYPARQLFSIDWAMLSWPETYYLVLVPGFDRYVVVKSSLEEGTGGPWLALGWFGRAASIRRRVEAIISCWWSFQAGQGQERWESFLTPGIFNKNQVARWADEVWADYQEEEEEESDEDEELDEDQDEASETEVAE